MTTRTQWIHGPLTDAVLAWLWLPIFVVVHLAEGHGDLVPALMAIGFVISFAHQPLTMGLVYGDPVQYRHHRRLYLVTPVVLAVLVTVGMFWSLTAVAIVAALWNAEHTLMQRYGLTRIYGRKAGDDLGRIEKPMYISWLVFALLWLPSFVNLPKMADNLGFGARNKRGLEVLYDLRGPARALLVVGAVVAVVFTVRWLLAQRRLAPAQRSAPKYLYVGATFGLVLAIMVDPAAGFVSYISAHALEYFVIVDASLRKRAATGDPVAVIRAVQTRRRRALVYTSYLAAMVAVSVVTIGWFDGQFYAWLVLFFGGLHVFYDGFVWKLRRPGTAASLGIPATVGVPPTVAPAPAVG
ncbi:MAG: hypothetical protein RL219_555 [Actinomycetota bacterium]